MNDIKLYLLKLINQINNSEEVSLRSLDTRIMRKYPEIIYNKQLKEYLMDLRKDDYIRFIDDMTVVITDKGIQQLNN